MPRYRYALPALALSLALVATACGSDDDSSSTGAAAPSASAAGVLGPLKKAVGEPIIVGFDSTGVSATLDYSAEMKAVKAVADYANEHLGGLGGRPIKLMICEDKSVPATAADCGNQFVAAKAAVVTMGSPGALDSVIAPILPAGIPVVANNGATKSILSSDGAFVLGNGISSFGTAALFAREHGLKKAAMIIIDVPAAVGPAKALLPGFFSKVGATVDVVPIAGGTADMSPQIQIAANAKPDLYYVIGDPNFCTSALRAIKTLGLKGQLLALDRCIDASQVANIPGGYAGISMISIAVTNADDKEYQLFDAILNTYAEKRLDRNRAVNGYQGLLGMIRAVNASGTTDLSPAGIKAALKGMPPTPYPLGGGATFQCNGQAIPAISKNICLNAGFVAKADQQGHLSDFEALEAKGLYSTS